MGLQTGSDLHSSNSYVGIIDAEGGRFGRGNSGIIQV